MFTGKRVLVTGAGRGIGRAIAVELAKLGANVIALSLTQENLNTLKKEFPSIETVCVDVRNWAATERAVSALGTLDMLVNNAGILGLQGVGHITEEQVDDIFAVNVKAVINISQTVAKGMKKRGSGGSIVNISSQSAMVALVDHCSYCASKGALDQITKVMALELGPHQIRVNSVNPTVVLTDMGKGVVASWGSEEAERLVKSRIPLGRFCEVEDVVKATLFLLSNDSKIITGASLPLEGGYTIQ